MSLCAAFPIEKPTWHSKPHDHREQRARRLIDQTYEITALRMVVMYSFYLDDQGIQFWRAWVDGRLTHSVSFLQFLELADLFLIEEGDG